MVAAVGVRATQVVVLAAGAQPAAGVRVTQALVVGATDSQGNEVRATQALVLVAALGRVANPNIRVWTYTMDAHDFVVVHLGTTETLVCDLSMSEWYNWGTQNDDLWRANTGMNWPGAGQLLGVYGSDVLCGDDSTGTLYFLNPDSELDEGPFLGADDPTSFVRQLTSQHVIDSGYDYESCFGVHVLGSIGGGADDVLTVELEYSDTRGATWQSAGAKTVTPNDYETRLDWMSLGAMRVPGRLFRLTDYGVLKRVDKFNLEVEDDQQ